MNRITCEVCGSNDVLKQESVFVCEACGCKYSLEEVKKLVVEIANPVKVVGMDDADALYDRALEWLNLQNEAKAIAVLEDMVEKYPGDKRGWGKLARITLGRSDIDHVLRLGGDCSLLLTQGESYIDNALRLGDDSLLCDIENINKSREAAAQKACDEIRSGNGEKWLTQNFRYNGRFALDGKFSCVQDLMEESRTNADYYRKLLASPKPGGSWMVEKYVEELNKVWNFSAAGGKVERIIGNIFIISWDERDVGTLYRHYTTGLVLTKDVIQRTFFELDRRLSKNGLCAQCGTPKHEKQGFLSKITYCPVCEKR